MSATATAFAGSGHGILAGMSTRPRSSPGDPMRNMRANGVFDVSKCRHQTILSADPWPDHVPVPTFGLHTVAMPIATIVMSNHMDPGPFQAVRQLRAGLIGCACKLAAVRAAANVENAW